MEESLKHRINIHASQVIFNEYMYEWLETYKKDTISPRTYKTYKKTQNSISDQNSET